MAKQEQDHTDKHPESRGIKWPVTQQIKRFVREHLPWFSRTDDADCILESYRKHDPTENAETLPPEDEYVDLRCMWAVEFYTPSHIDKLVDNFRKLKWDQDEFPGRESPASWVRMTRQLPEGDNWLNLGTIRSTGDKTLWPRRDRTAPLPMNVDYARGGLYSITPSLTCIVICFVFEDRFRSRLDQTLRRYRQTFTRPVSRGHEIFDPERQKTEEARRARRECANLAAKWFRENLPGVFSSGLLVDQLPTYELVTLRKADPFPALEVAEPPPGYLRVLDLKISPVVWRSKDIPGLKFSFGLLGHRLEYHSVLAVRETDMDNSDFLHSYGGLPGLAAFVDRTYQKMIGLVALQPLLDGYSRCLNNLRDNVTTEIRRKGRRRPVDTLQKLVNNVAYDVDIAAITTDLISSTGEPTRFWRDLAGFEPCYDWQSQVSLSESFRLAVNNHATRLKQTDQSLRDHLTQFGSLLAATEDVRSQNQMLWHTRLVAALTVFVTAMTLLTFLATDLGSGMVSWLQDAWRHMIAAIPT